MSKLCVLFVISLPSVSGSFTKSVIGTFLSGKWCINLQMYELSILPWKDFLITLFFIKFIFKVCNNQESVLFLIFGQILLILFLNGFELFNDTWSQ